MKRSILKISEDAKVECSLIGQECEPLLKVDSFLMGAKELKQYAVDANDFGIADSYYPGIRMPVPMDYTIAIAKNLAGYIKEFFCLDLSKVKTAASRFSIVTFRPENLGILQRIPHFDAVSRNSLAMVHYLCDETNSGTAMYRHRESGFEYVDGERYEKYMEYIRNQFDNPILYPNGYICGDTKEFDLITSYHAQFNRLIMYRGSSLHSGIINPDYNFDPDPATGRLTVTTFIEFA